MVNAKEHRVRLSTHVVFVDYGFDIEIQHTLRDQAFRIDRTVYDDLLRFQAFHEPSAGHTQWIDAGVLVPPFKDGPEYHGGIRPGSEAQLARDYQDWYWRHEIESERDYRWLGYTVQKMPCDLFFYQELIERAHIRTVLELGYGRGGALWFFGTVLSLLGGGAVVGVDRDPADTMPPFASLRDVRVDVVHADAHDPATSMIVHSSYPSGFDLVVIDADPSPVGKLELLEQWATMVAPGGYLVLEDTGSPLCCAEGPQIADAIDRMLLRSPQFELPSIAARFPMLKGRGAVIHRSAT